jgi:hypothetical protein
LSAAAQRFELSASPWLPGILVLLHAAAAAAVLVALPTAWGAALAAGLLALGLAAAWSRALLRSPRSVRAIELRQATATLELEGGERIACELAERRYVSRGLVSLVVRRPLRRTVLISGDMLPAPAFRRLRLWALWGARATQENRTYSR